MEAAILSFEFSDNVKENDNKNSVELFFDSWLTQNCINDYVVRRTQVVPLYGKFSYGLDILFFDSQDASFIKLKGIPTEFQRYVSLKE